MLSIQTMLTKVLKNSPLNMVWIFHFNDINVNFSQKLSIANFLMANRNEVVATRKGFIT